MATAIELTHGLLLNIYSQYHLPLPGKKLSLFGFRGMLPVKTAAGWQKKIVLKTAKVDYRFMRCSLGIWDPKAKRVFAAPGSTVPYRDHVIKAAGRGGKGANQLEPGYYTDYVKGEHLEGKELGHQGLRQSRPRFIRRAVHGIPIGKKDRLLFSNPYDNLHCSWNPNPQKPGFSSAGCLVVAGKPFCKRQDSPVPNQGSWKVFHQIIYGAGQRKFSILLLDAAQVKAVLRGAGAKPLLCFGSQGSAVKALQRRLKSKGAYKGRITGQLDARTYRAWNNTHFEI